MILPCRCHRGEGIGVDVNRATMFFSRVIEQNVSCVLVKELWLSVNIISKIFSVEYA